MRRTKKVNLDRELVYILECVRDAASIKSGKIISMAEASRILSRKIKGWEL